MTQTGRRRLSAILSADVAGYSRLMQDDERATVAALDDCRGVFRGCIEAHSGRLVDVAGDSVLAVFDSVVEAVGCALAVQDALAARNTPVAETRRMLFRIGVNLGDVIEHADGTVYGDGVNIAARLESLAEPGGLLVSGSVHDMAEGKIEARFAFAGEQRVKNIAKPVRAYRVTRGNGRAVARPAPVSDRPSIAVLPFLNMSGDPEQEYFSDGIAEDIITELSKIAGLFVIARNSAFVYKGKAVNVPEVAAALGVRTVLEGSVRKAGKRVRITAQLIDGESGGHLWAERYDRELEDIFAVQDEVTAAIVSQLSVKLSGDERRRIAHPGTDNMEAYDLFLRGREQAWSHSRGANVLAQSYLRRAVALDPDFAAAHAMLAVARVLDHVNDWGSAPETALAEAHEMAEKALALDDRDPLAHWVMTLAYMWGRAYDRALAEAETTLALDPNFQHAHATLGAVRHYLGDSAAAIPCFETAIRLDPHYPDMFLHFLAQCHYMCADYETAKDLCRARIARSPETDASRVLMAACCGMLGERDEAEHCWHEVFRVNPDYSLAQRRRVLPYRNPADFDRLVEGLRKAGIDPDDGG